MTSTLSDPRKVFGRAVTRKADADERVVVISADSGLSSGFGPFRDAHPDRYFELGIQEHGATGFAAGLATTGRIPVFAAIAAFVTNRNYEAFRNDIAYMRQNVKVVGRNGGMTYSELGPTHYSLEDYAIMRMLPGVVVLSPQDPAEIEEAVVAMIDHEGPVYMRIGGPHIPSVLPRLPFEIGRGRLLEEGNSATIVTTGTATPETISAVESLKTDGLLVDLIAMPTVEPLDAAIVEASARKTGLVVTVEEHYVRGGLSSAVAEALEGVPVMRVALGVPHTHAMSGTYAELKSIYGLDAAGLRSRIEAAISAS